MAYGARLESVLGVKALGGSNPPFSAKCLTRRPAGGGALDIYWAAWIRTLVGPCGQRLRAPHPMVPHPLVPLSSVTTGGKYRDRR